MSCEKSNFVKLFRANTINTTSVGNNTVLWTGGRRDSFGADDKISHVKRGRR